jgi:hypothetical protein
MSTADDKAKLLNSPRRGSRVELLPLPRIRASVAPGPVVRLPSTAFLIGHPLLEKSRIKKLVNEFILGNGIKSEYKNARQKPLIWPKFLYPFRKIAYSPKNL